MDQNKKNAKESRRNRNRNRSRSRSQSRSRSRSRSQSKEKSHKPRPIDVFLDMASSVSKHDDTTADKQKKDAAEKKVEKEKPNFEPSGILAAERNTVKYVIAFDIFQ